MLRPTDQLVRPAQTSNNRIVVLYQMSCEMYEITTRIAVGAVCEILYFIQIKFELFFFKFIIWKVGVGGVGVSCLTVTQKVKHVLDRYSPESLR
jgi:hypothetical protein